MQNLKAVLTIGVVSMLSVPEAVYKGRCLKCKNPMRKQGSKPIEGVRIHQARGFCSYCYQRQLESGELSARPRNEYTEEEIKCYSCGLWKPYAKFKLNKSNKTGREYMCALCSKLWERYSLTFLEYMKILEDQLNACDICKTPFDEDITPFVDHNHSCCSTRSCGICVRGLLCSKCNTGIGAFLDNPDLLSNASTYLRKYL